MSCCTSPAPLPYSSTGTRCWGRKIILKSPEIWKKSCRRMQKGSHRQYIPPAASPTAHPLDSGPQEGGAVWIRGCTDSGWWNEQGIPPFCYQTCARSPPPVGHHRTLRAGSPHHIIERVLQYQRGSPLTCLLSWKHRCWLWTHLGLFCR